MSKLIPLSKGQFAIVDDEDYDWLTRWKWRIRIKKDRPNIFYVIRSAKNGPISMHRTILPDIPAGMEIDHINGNPLDNRRSNLRICTHRQNACNRKKMSQTSQYKGVTWNKRSSKWQAQVMSHQKMFYLGLFTSEFDAAKAYDAAARKHFGEFARLNFPESE